MILSLAEIRLLQDAVDPRDLDNGYRQGDSRRFWAKDEARRILLRLAKEAIVEGRERDGYG